MGNWLSWIKGVVMGSSVSTEVLDQKHVIIIGGGYGGMELAATLLKWKVPFTLIDPKEYFHHNVGALRAAVNPEYIAKTTIDYKETFGDHFLCGTVTSVDLVNKKVTVDNSGDELTYTDLVFAVGSSGPFPGRTDAVKVTDAVDVYTELGKEIEKATNVIIIGGGAVGVEIAGEIGDRYRAKQITIIHSNSTLVSPKFGESFQRRIKSCLEEKSIELLLDERVANIGDLTFNKFMKQTVKTNKGHSYEADIVLKCTGLAPNTSLTKKIFDGSNFDGENRLKVTPELLVSGEDHVFAIGDCINTQEEKMAAHASTHAATVGNNIWRDMNGQSMLAYKQKFSGMVVTVGAYAGAGMVNGWNLPSFIVGLAKGRGLFTAKYWSIMGQPVPN